MKDERGMKDERAFIQFVFCYWTWGDEWMYGIFNWIL